MSGEQGSEGQIGVAGMIPRKGRKRDEPHGRQPGATSRRDRGGASRRSGGKPQGRNMVDVGRRRPEGEVPQGSSPGVDSAHRERRRGDLRQPQERQLDVPTSSGMSRTASGKTAPKVKREFDLATCVVMSAPRDGPRRPRVHRESGTQRRSRRAAAMRCAATSSGAFPMVGEPIPARSQQSERAPRQRDGWRKRQLARFAEPVDGPTVAREAERWQRCPRSKP